MKVSKSLVSVFACLLTALPAIAPAAAAQDRPPGERPRIGLVLAGGGAKGGAHIGVLKVWRKCACRSTASPAPAWAR